MPGAQPGGRCPAPLILDDSEAQRGLDRTGDAGPRSLSMGIADGRERLRRLWDEHLARTQPSDESARPGAAARLVELRLRAAEAVTSERLDGVGRSSHESFGVLVRSEGREDVVRDGPAVAAARPADADPDTEELGRA